jgi:transposase
MFFDPGRWHEKKAASPPQVDYHRLKNVAVTFRRLGQRPNLWETAMYQTILLTVDYHDQNCVIRRRALKTQQESVSSIPTTPEDLVQVVAQARKAAGRQGRVVWIQESTTGWARVKTLLADKVDEFTLANVLQMPLPPKARRRKTDKVDTARIQREYLNGELPRAHQPPAWWRQLRRLVSYRENLVSRQTGIRNWINRYLAHETWENRGALWSSKGEKRLRKLVVHWPPWDRMVVQSKLEELHQLKQNLSAVEAELQAVYKECPEAQRVDAVRGIGMLGAVSIVARVGPVERFRTAEQLIAYAGLAPGISQSDDTRRSGRIGGGGTDRHLRNYLIEASVWARNIPRYKTTYERVAKRRGKKIGRIVVARMLTRSIYKILKDDVVFEASRAAASDASKTAEVSTVVE